MARRLLTLGLFAALPLIAVLGLWRAVAVSDISAPPPLQRDHKLAHDGVERTYHVIASGNYLKHPAPLVIALHGGGGDAEYLEMALHLEAKARRSGFILVYPEGTGRFRDRLLTWNAHNCCGYAREKNVDDVGFIRELIAAMKKDFNVDPARVYVTGLSNGGMMAYRLGCELSDQIAAIAPVAGALNGDCAPTHPISVIIFHGTADQHVLFDGGAPRKTFRLTNRVDRSVQYAVDFWVKQNGCEGEPTRATKGHVRSSLWGKCRAGTAVALYVVEGGGHCWPGGDAAWRGGDEPTKEISANDLMWDFFQAHPKK
jgi:polyhydroxybutyrate depolymerase